MHKKRHVFLICILLLIGIICLFLRGIKIQLKPLTTYPTELPNELSGTANELYYWYSISLVIPAKIPFVIHNIEISDHTLQEKEAQSKLFVYEYESKTLHPGGGFITLDWLIQNYPDITSSKNLSMYTSEAAIFILTPAEIAVQGKEYTITMDYSWLGFFENTASIVVR